MKKFLDSFLGKIIVADLAAKDWLLKFVSLVLAVVLWYFVGGENRVDKIVMIPIEIINLPRDLVISNQFKKEIEVTVSGPRSIILEMTDRAITRQIDLSRAMPGTMVIENDNDHIPVPRGITVQRVQPSSIILSLDKLVQKKFSIAAKTVGKVAAGYYMKSLKMDPEVITITGPHTILSQLDKLSTKAINLEGMKESVQLQVPLELEPAIVELIGQTSVTADLSVGIETIVKTLDDLVVAAEIDGVKREVRPKTVKVVADIPRLLLTDNFDPQKLLSVTAIQQEGEETLKVQVIPRADVEVPIEILSIFPATVTLKSTGYRPVDKLTFSLGGTSENDGEERKTESAGDEAPATGAADSGEAGDKKAPTLKLLKSEKSKRKLVE